MPPFDQDELHYTLTLQNHQTGQKLTPWDKSAETLCLRAAIFVRSSILCRVDR